MAEEVVKNKVVKKKVKKKKNRLLGFVIFLSIIAGIVLFLMFFPSCSFLDTITKGFSTRYEFSNHYKATSSYVEHGYIDMININWRDGDVKVYTHDSDEISIVETPNETVTEKFMMHYNYQETDKYGHSILIQYCKSGNYKFGDLKKDLTVYIPSREDLHITIHTYNSDITFDLGETKLSELQVQSNHGSVDGIFADANKVTLLGSSAKTVKSGYHFNIVQTGKSNQLRYSTCQSMNIKANEAAYVEGGGVWGEIKLDILKADRAEIKLGSYKFVFYIGEIKNIKITDKYTNGENVYLYFDTDASYNININRKELKENGEVVERTTTNNIGEKVSDSVYKIGSGTNTIDITVSGNLSILSKE